MLYLNKITIFAYMNQNLSFIMKKTLFTLLATLMLCLASQAQEMNSCLHIADYVLRMDVKVAHKVMKQEGFKKVTRRDDTIFYTSKKTKTDAMLVIVGDHVDYMKFLFSTAPSPREVEGAARMCGYKPVGGMGPNRKFIKEPYALYTSPVQDDPHYVYGFVIKYEPQGW